MKSDDIFRETRKEYTQGRLDEESVAANPIEQFSRWLSEAAASGHIEPTACALATVGADGQPSVRMVLLKSFDDAGFVFFTNYLSRKGEQLSANNRAALLFYWPHGERQVRIEGVCQRISVEESDAYFKSRPRGAQIGAIISLQSRTVSSREVIEESYKKFERQIGDEPVTRPSSWGGYRIMPGSFEFWQGRESRLHDRITFTRGSSGWDKGRLWP